MKNTNTTVVINDHQPAEQSAAVAASATHEGVNALPAIKCLKIKSQPKPNCDQPTPPRMLLKISEAAHLLGLSAASIRRLITRGELAVNRKMRHVLIPRVEVERFAMSAKREGI